jgi:integrase
MSPQSASRVNPDPIKTLADVVDAVRAADLPKQRRQEIASALRTAARAIGKPLDRVPADPRRLAALMSEVSPISLNISLERWANVRSLTRAGLALVQPMAPGRHITPLSPGWRALWRQLKARLTKMALSRFARFCSVRGIEPEGMTAETIEAFRAYLNDSLLKSPDRIFGAMARGWRAAQTAVESWPRIGITVPNRRRDWTLAWSRFPVSLEQDCAAWCDRLAGRDLLAEGPVRIVRPGTVAHRERQIRTFASALARQGRDPTTLVSLKDLVEIEALKTGLMFLFERSGGKTTTTIYDFVSALKAIARHHLHVDQHHLDQMARIMRRLDVDRRGLTQKNRSRLRHLDDRQNVAALLRLPHTLIDLAARNPRPYAGALQAQTAVAIEILLMAPLRIGNLARLDLEQNLVRPGRSNIVHVVIEPEDVKNREPLEYPLPPEGVALIDCYLREFRPRFAPPGCCTALFPGRNGGSKSLNALRDQICKAVHRYTGMKMNPHLFRHAGAKLYLDANPGEYEVVRRVLAHRSISTTTGFYTGLESASAVRHFDATILKQRKGERPNDQDPAP